VLPLGYLAPIAKRQFRFTPRLGRSGLNVRCTTPRGGVHGTRLHGTVLSPDSGLNIEHSMETAHRPSNPRLMPQTPTRKSDVLLNNIRLRLSGRLVTVRIIPYFDGPTRINIKSLCSSCARIQLQLSSLSEAHSELGSIGGRARGRVLFSLVHIFRDSAPAIPPPLSQLPWFGYFVDTDARTPC
jgi:hypothetical protein